MAEWYGEGSPSPTNLRHDSHLISPAHHYQEAIKTRKLVYEEASKCLNTLGKDASGIRYAYLMLTALDKNLTDVTVIVNFNHLLYVDLSGNYLNLAALQVLCELPYLLYLKAERNIVESAALQPMPYLQVLILNKNQIIETSDIVQPMLETLELGENALYLPQFYKEQLPSMKELSLHGNYLIDTSGSYPSTLEKLYLNRNKITKITPDICNLKYLQTLNLRENFIKKLNGFSSDLSNLTYLNLRKNKIQKLREFSKLKYLPKLDTIIVSENPIYKNESKPNIGEEDVSEEEDDDDVSDIDNEGKRIRLSLLVLLPNLKRINKTNVTDQEREEVNAKKVQLSKKIFEEESSEEEADITLTTTDFTTEYTTETSVEMKGTPNESSYKLYNYSTEEEIEASVGRKVEKTVHLARKELEGG